ncbi:MAG: YlbF family regulator [Anaeroplasmataceae bacterium]
MFYNIDEIKDNLIKSINDLPNIKRLHELEGIIDSNPLIQEKFNRLKEIQKKKVNSDYYNKVNASKEYNKELLEIKKELADIPFLGEYIDLLEEAYYMLKNISLIMTDEINKNI